MASPRPMIRFARAGERRSLEDLQLRASQVWKQFRAALRAHPDAIAIPAEQLRERRVRVAEVDDCIVGFAAIVRIRAGTMELDGLFVEPQQMNTGIGRALIFDAIRLSRRRGGSVMEVTAGPAEGFYLKMGFTTVPKTATRFGGAVRMRRTI